MLGGASEPEARRAGRTAQPHLLGAAPARLLAQPVLRSEDERHSEQSLHHPLVDLARKIDSSLEQPRAPAGWSIATLAANAAVLPSVHIAWRSSAVSEGPAAMVGRVDHPELSAGRHRRAGDRGQVRQPGARRQPALELVGDLHHAILGQRDLGDLGLLERSVHLREQAGVDAVAAHRHHELAVVVVEQQPGAAHRSLPASAPRRGGRRSRGGGNPRPASRVARRSRRARRSAAKGRVRHLRVVPLGGHCCRRLGEKLCASSQRQRHRARVAARAAAALRLSLEVADLERPLDVA